MHQELLVTGSSSSGEARVVSLVVHSITFTFPVLHSAGDWADDSLARWYIVMSRFSFRVELARAA